MEHPDWYARMFRRHANPWSAWTRLLSTPLLLVPLWTRRWWLYGPVAAWLAVNPVVFPEATDEKAFATRAMLAEEQWSRDMTSEPAVTAVSAAAGVLLVAAMVAAYRKRRGLMVSGTAGFMVLTLLEWKLLAEEYAKAR